VILLRRSAAVGECPGMVVMPGGHPEPSMLPPAAAAGTTAPSECPAVAPSEVAPPGLAPSKVKVTAVTSRSQAIVHELFDSAVREVVEETGIPRSALGAPLFLGMSRRVLNHRPDMIFCLQCAMTSQEVLARYNSGGVEDKYESTAMLAVPAEGAFAAAAEGGTFAMPGCHLGGLKLYSLHLDQRRVR
jgi:8-oxo-dGTP pyrophosphatase MutT (NUDIX family)